MLRQRFSSLIWQVILLLILNSAASSTPAAAASQRIAIAGRQRKNFIQIARSGKDRIFCRSSGARVDAGIGHRRGRTYYWKSYRTLIAEAKHNRHLSRARRKRLQKNLAKARAKFLLACQSKLHPAATPTLTPIPTPTSTGTEPGDHGLHVIITRPDYVVDYDGDGAETVPLNGRASHTHELGQSIIGWIWTVDGQRLGEGVDFAPRLALGSHSVQLTIVDTKTPPAQLSLTETVHVYPITHVGGLLLKVYQSSNPGQSLDALPPAPSFESTVDSASLAEQLGKIGVTPFSHNVVVTLSGSIAVPSATVLSASGGTESRLYVDGTLVPDPASISEGTHSVELRAAVTSLADLPVRLMLGSGSESAVITSSDAFHDEASVTPFINQMPTEGSLSGGEEITISGFGFIPPQSVSINWGGLRLSASALTVTPNSIVFRAPAGNGSIPITVQTASGSSNASIYQYNSALVPIHFTETMQITDVTPDAFSKPTQAEWGPDGRLYVASLGGQIMAYRFNDDYSVADKETITTIANLTNRNILGIAFNPWDPPTPVKIYVAHSELYSQSSGNECPNSAFEYSSEVSVLTGPDFSKRTSLVKNLPTSNHDHGVNGIAFDGYGDLYISSGGTTNAGIADCYMGGIPESPLSAAILKAPLSRGAIQGTLAYVNDETGLIDMDGRDGGVVSVLPGIDVELFASGVRDAFDITWTTNEQLYMVDNGAGTGFGATSTSATTESPDPVEQPDEINLCIEGHYYGHPNRNRGRSDSRQNSFRGATESAISGVYTPPIALTSASTDGVAEYRATTFNGAMQGQLLAQRFSFQGQGSTYRFKLSEDGRTVLSTDQVNTTISGVDVIPGPGGVLFISDLQAGASADSKLHLLTPDDPTVGLKAFDIFPWRAPSSGGAPFVIGGRNFGQDASVTIGGIAARITAVSPTRIHGVIPAARDPSAALLDVAVASDGAISSISKAFRYLLPPHQGRGVWRPESALDRMLDGATSASLDGMLYVVGGGAPDTFAFDAASGSWTTRAPRPVVGRFATAVSSAGKIYLFGGEGSGANAVQIYTPATNDWSIGAAMPFSAGGVSAAAINGKIYVVGGIDGNGSALTTAALYDPNANSWTTLPSMPSARAFAGAGCDGQSFFVMGGERAGSVLSEVVLFNPGTNSWSIGAPLPAAHTRFGSVPLFHNELYVVGGLEAGSTATARVEAYDSSTNSWRSESALPNAGSASTAIVSGRLVSLTPSAAKVAIASFYR